MLPSAASASLPATRNARALCCYTPPVLMPSLRRSRKEFLGPLQPRSGIAQEVARITGAGTSPNTAACVLTPLASAALLGRSTSAFVGGAQRRQSPHFHLRSSPAPAASSCSATKQPARGVCHQPVKPIALLPNPSLKLSPNSKTPGPGCSPCHHLQRGPGVLLSAPA